MTGILETMNTKITALETTVAELAAKVASIGGTATTTAAAAVDPFAAFGSTTPPAATTPAVPENVTGEQITALIQPHLANEAIKGQLGEAMRSMGINALPETQPHQYRELYGKFLTIINGGASAGAGTTAAAGASII